MKETSPAVNYLIYHIHLRDKEGGTFLIGADNGERDDMPSHDVQLDSFLMDPVLVTNQEFADREKIIANFGRNGWRLPTEVEWERAAREDIEASGRLGSVDPTAANYGKHYRGTTSVGRFKANPLGIYDLIGNAKEWCHDHYDPRCRPDRRA